MPLSNEDRKSDKYEKGVSCLRCYDSLSSEKKRRLRERNKQIEIAKRKGMYNPYLRSTPTSFL